MAESNEERKAREIAESKRAEVKEAEDKARKLREDESKRTLEEREEETKAAIKRATADEPLRNRKGEPLVMETSPEQEEAERMRKLEGRPKASENEMIREPTLEEMEARKAIRMRAALPIGGTASRRAYLKEANPAENRTLKVIATDYGFYEGWQEPGTRFPINPKLFSENWMVVEK